MTKLLSILLITLFSVSLYAGDKNILFIGDSHSAGPFGSRLHKLLSQSPKSKRVVTLGHASSSSTHWMVDRVYKLSGGVFHQFSNQNDVQFPHPNPTHWRVKVEVPKLVDVLANPLMHSTWDDTEFKFDTIVVELGANDARAIADQEGVINPWEYTKRQDQVIKMVEMIKANGLKCFWVGPPNAIKKTEANQKVLYKMLTDVVTSQCEFFSSNHYKAEGCDGIHFNCSSERPKALRWAREVSDFVLRAL